MAVVGREDLLQHDRQRPAVEHDVVIGQDEPMPIGCGADECRTECRLAGGITDRGTFGSAELVELFLGIQFQVVPGDHRFGRNDLHRLIEVLTEPRRQVRMTFDDVAHRIPQPVRVEFTGQGDVQLHGVDVVGAPGERGVEQQSLLNRGQRQHVGDFELPFQRVDLVLIQLGRQDVRRGETASAVAYMGADPAQRLEPEPTEPVDLLVIERGGGPGPRRLQRRAGLGVQGAGVESHGVHQRHVDRRGGAEE